MAERNLDIVIKAHDMATSVFSKAGDAASSFGGRVKSTAENLINVKTVAIAATAAVAGLTYELVKAVQAANEAEAAETRLRTTLGFTSRALLDQSVALQRVTTFGDNQIQNVQAAIAAFTRNESVIKSLTKATLDLASAKGIDLASAGDLIAKSFGSSTNALARYGIQAEAAAGSTEKLKQITEGIAALYGGQAEAVANTFGGRIAQLKNAFGDLQEEIGFVFTKSSFFIGATKVLTDALVNMGQWVNNNRLWLMELVKSGIVSFVDGIGKAVEVIRFFHNGWLGLKLVANATAIVFADTLRVVFEGLRMVLLPLDLIYQGLVKLGVVASNPFDRASEAIGQFQLSTRDVMTDTVAEVERVNATYDQMGIKINAAIIALKNLKVAQAEAAAPVAPKAEPETFDPALDKEATAIQKRIDLLIRKNQLENEHLGETALRTERRLSFMGMEIENQIAYDEMSQRSTQGRTRVLESAYGAMEDQMLSLIETGKFSVGALAQAIAQQVKIELVGLAARASIWAIYETAMGLRDLAAGSPTAGLHFASAAKFAAVAGGAMAVAAGVHSAFGGHAERPAPGSPAGEPIRTTPAGITPTPLTSSAGNRPTQHITVNVYNPLSEQNWAKITEDNIVPAINAAGDRNIKINVNAVGA